ncbi:MAG TPA: patatin-like phospholipase family protein [Bacteroidota bacterium]|nr:patatin-like phospholipase family protein [Bacteroidota bacterium]
MRHILRASLCVILLAHGGAMQALAGSPITIRPRLEASPVAPPGFLPRNALIRPRVALVLTGGGARAVAQIGVLRIFERYGIPVDFIVGTSLGAIVGGLYASGYSVDELDSLATTTPWDDILSLTDATKRTELFVDQKLAGDRSFLVVRFQGLEPVLPSAVSSGQRLTDFLSTQALQALYHPIRSFDDLRIPFRSVATDLVSGQRVVLKDGSLAEALRASATVPLLFDPIEKDSMELIDGGLLSNIPVDVARSEGYDIVIVVNSTSALRTAEEMKLPWQTADQIMSITMKALNDAQLQNADIVITPEIGKHLSSNFHGLADLIRAGQAAAEASIPEIQALYQSKLAQMQKNGRASGEAFASAAVDFDGPPPPEALRAKIDSEAQTGILTSGELQEDVEALYSLGCYRNVQAEIDSPGNGTAITFALDLQTPLKAVDVEGNTRIATPTIQSEFRALIGRPFVPDSGQAAIDRVLRLYRAEGYSLARMDSVHFDDRNGILFLRINEGVIARLDVQGGERTRDAFVLNEFPLHTGDVFQIDKARKGISNIASTTLFQYVYLEVAYISGQPAITIRLRERPSQLVRLGLRADNERSLQGLIDIRDDNFQGSGMDLGLTVAGGQRNLDATLEYKARRLFNSYMTLGVAGFVRTLDSYLYADAPETEENHWARDQVGEYRDIRYGFDAVFGTPLERLGNATIEFNLQNVRVKSISQADFLDASYRLALVRFGTVVDSKDRYPFPLSGVGLNLSYEFAFDGLGSSISYNSLSIMYETYSTWGSRHTFHPRFTFGFADKTMPYAQEFRLGGRTSFFGVREDDRRGRELLLLNVEYRYFLPVRILFDSYIRARYDLGTISEVPEEIKLSTFRHGLGMELALDTPVGQAALGVGKSFFFNGDLPNRPIQWGPVLWYFTIGYEP